MKFDDMLKRQMRDPEFRAAYEAPQPEFDAVQAVADGMTNGLTYKGLMGSVDWTEDDAVFYGTLQNGNTPLSYFGQSEMELIGNFHAAVDK